MAIFIRCKIHDTSTCHLNILHCYSSLGFGRFSWSKDFGCSAPECGAVAGLLKHGISRFASGLARSKPHLRTGHQLNFVNFSDLASSSSMYMKHTEIDFKASATKLAFPIDVTSCKTQRQNKRWLCVAGVVRSGLGLTQR